MAKKYRVFNSKRLHPIPWKILSSSSSFHISLHFITLPRKRILPPFEMSDISYLIESSIIISRDKYLTLGKKRREGRKIEGDEKRDFICNLESVVNNLKFKIRKRSAVSLLLRRPRFIKSLSR